MRVLIKDSQPPHPYLDFYLLPSRPSILPPHSFSSVVLWAAVKFRWSFYSFLTLLSACMFTAESDLESVETVQFKSQVLLSSCKECCDTTAELHFQSCVNHAFCIAKAKFCKMFHQICHSATIRKESAN